MKLFSQGRTVVISGGQGVVSSEGHTETWSTGNVLLLDLTKHVLLFGKIYFITKNIVFFFKGIRSEAREISKYTRLNSMPQNSFPPGM